MAKLLMRSTVILLFLVTLTTAEIKSLKITSDSRQIILFENFGFTHSGYASISISDVFVTSSSPIDPSRLGFFLLSQESVIQVLVELQQQHDQNSEGFCVLDSIYIHLLFTFRDLSPPPFSSFNHSFPITSPGEYSLFFVNCLAPDSKVSMDVRTELFNVRHESSGDRKDYLSAGISHIPTLYFLFSLVYIAFLALWIYYCLQNKRSSHKIHLLMAVLLLAKSLNLILAAEDKHRVKTTGAAHGWDLLLYLFQAIRLILLFTVIVLIGTGWSFLKPFLHEREKKVLMIVIPLQVLANVALAVIGETGPIVRNLETWYPVFFLVDILCCFFVIIPIIWSIRSLRETAKSDGKAARNLAKLNLFRRFYIVVIGYLYFTRVVVYVLLTIVNYKYQWVAYAAEEIVGLAFYMVMFYMFRPVEKNKYFVLDEEEERAAEMALRSEEFDL